MIPIGYQTVPTSERIAHHSSESEEEVAVCIKLEEKEFKLLIDKPVIDQLRQDTERKPTHVNISLTQGKVVIARAYHGFGIPLYFASNLPEALDTTRFKGDIRVKGFAICLNERSEMLCIRKRKGMSWHLPGGLVTTSDKSIWNAAVRGLEKKTGMTVETSGIAIYAYESVTPPTHPLQHDIIVTFITQCPEIKQLTADPCEEILEIRWFKPADFLSYYLKDSSFSQTHIIFALNYLRKSMMREFFEKHPPGVENEYENQKNQRIKMINEMLFDLCFLEICQSNIDHNSMHFSKLAHLAESLAVQYMNIKIQASL